METRISPKINKKITYILYAIIFMCILSLSLTTKTIAKPVAGFNPGNIIDDFVFTNKNTMTADQIQAFLNSKVSACDTDGTQLAADFGRPDLTHAQYAASRGWPAPPYTCLKDYTENNLSSAQIIYNLAQQYKINPQVLIVLLQKEQGLVTDNWPLPIQYRSATGYGCPDTAPCDSQYYGLTNQLTWSSIMFRAIFDNSPTWYTPYILGDNFIRWSPNSACGGTTVNIENKATQSLYNYTPYQPNQAALNAGYGNGDSCSAYGNRNFYIYFIDWFGSTKANDTMNPHPDGTLININSRVYIIQNGSLHYIVNASIFESYNYRWQDIKTATTGDKQLVVSQEIDHMNPGTLFAAPGTSVYTTVYENNNWVKQLVSYSSFINLGYDWSQIRFIPVSDIPSMTSENIYFSNSHPDGTLIKNNQGVFIIDHNTKRYISPAVFASQRWRWEDIINESAGDSSISIGTNAQLRQGSIISDSSGLYVIEITDSGTEIKHPIGPWECYANIYKYNLNEVIPMFDDASFRIQTGSRVSC